MATPLGPVALVGDRQIVDAAGLCAGTAFDRTVDVVIGDRGLLGLLDRIPERRVPVGITAADPRRHLDVLDQLGEQLAALGVLGRLLVLGGSPLGMAAHRPPYPCALRWGHPVVRWAQLSDRRSRGVSGGRFYVRGVRRPVPEPVARQALLLERQHVAVRIVEPGDPGTAGCGPDAARGPAPFRRRRENSTPREASSSTASIDVVDLPTEHGVRRGGHPIDRGDPQHRPGDVRDQRERPLVDKSRSRTSA